ncbi:MAG TPA: FGLLP motif-containing membrane protein [Pseudonocardiaceae bacterium]
MSRGPSYYSADDTTDSYGGAHVSWSGSPMYGAGHTGADGDRAFVIGPGGVLTVDDPAAGNFATGDFTLHLFTRLAPGGGISQEVLSKRAECGWGSFLDLRAGLRFGGGVYFEVQDLENIGFHVHNPINILDGAWHEITVIRAGRLVSLTVDSTTFTAHTHRVVDLDTTAPMRFGDGPCAAGPGRWGDSTTRATGELDDVSFGPGTLVIDPPPPPAPLSPVQPVPGGITAGPVASFAPSSVVPVPSAEAAIPETTPTASPASTEPQAPSFSAPSSSAPAAEPPATAAAPPRPPASHGSPMAVGGGAGHGPAAVAFAGSLPSPTQVNLQLKQVAQDGSLAILLLALLSLPIGIINDTAEANADRLAAVTARARRLRVRVVASWSGRLPLTVGLASVALAGALEYGFVEPSFGLALSSLALVVGLATAFLVLNGVTKLPKLIFLRRAYNVHGSLTLFPAFAVVGIACVVVSRSVGLEPGLILGTLAGLATTVELRAEQEGRAAAVAATTLLVVGALAWVLRSPLVAAAGPEGAFLPSALGVALTAIVVAAAETLAFGLLPLSFLEGAALFAWSKIIWGAFAILGAFAFVHVLLHPASGAGSFTGRVTDLVILLTVYFVAAISFWAWFRFRVIDEQSVRP